MKPRLGWTIVVALICVGGFKWRFLGQMLLVYPELHFLTENRASKKKKTVDPIDSVSRTHEDYTI